MSSCWNSPAGIVMFECGTGKNPFADLLGAKPMMGARPSFPVDVDSEYKVLAEQCWHQDSTQRPTFETITAALDKMRSSDE